MLAAALVAAAGLRFAGVGTPRTEIALAPVPALASPAGAAIPVIVRFARPLHDPQVAAVLRDLGPVRRFPAINAAAAAVPAGQVAALGAHGAVRVVEPDAPVAALLGTATFWTGAQHTWAELGVDGDGDGNPAVYSPADMVIAVVDTGIDATHTDLSGGKVLGWHDAVGGRTEPYDDNGHGTHVAAIAAGAGQGHSALRGVAPGAGLVGVKVLGGGGSGTTSTVLAGLQWILDHREAYGIRVVNLSLGTSGCSDGTDSLSQMVNTLAESGIVVAAAAGNSGPGACTVGSPGAAAGAITVGALADPGERGTYLAAFSSRGPTADGRVKPDIAAPGVAIMSASANTGDGYYTLSGTSMATPHVAGAAALVLAANPSLTPAGVRQVLMDTAADWGTPGTDREYGAGALQVYQAVAAAMGAGDGGGPLSPGHVHHAARLAGAGDVARYTLTVADTAVPIAATLIMPAWVDSAHPDFGLALYAPDGQRVGGVDGSARQERLSYAPGATGEYTVEVYGSSATLSGGDFWLDVSAGTGPVTLPPAFDPPPETPPVRPEPEPAPPPPDQPPIDVIWYSPYEGMSAEGTLLLEVLAYPREGTVESVTWSLDEGPAQPLSYNAATGRWQGVWDSTAAANGAHTATAVAGDDLGNSVSAGVTFTVDNPPPPPPPSQNWSSGDLEGGVFRADGKVATASKTYSYALPDELTVVESAVLTIRVRTYSAAGSSASDGVPPGIVLADGGGAEYGRLSPTGPGTYTLPVSDPAAADRLHGGTLVVTADSLGKRGKKQDVVEIDLVQVGITYH